MREHICVHTHNVLSYMFTKIILQSAGTSTVHIYTHEHQNCYSLQTRCSMVLHCKVGYRFIISINLNSYNVENCRFSLTYSMYARMQGHYICVCKDITYVYAYICTQAGQRQADACTPHSEANIYIFFLPKD